jgi:hypothetical protein
MLEARSRYWEHLEEKQAEAGREGLFVRRVRPIGVQSRVPPYVVSRDNGEQAR